MNFVPIKNCPLSNTEPLTVLGSLLTAIAPPIPFPATYKRKLLMAELQIRVHNSRLNQDESVECVFRFKFSVKWSGCSVDSVSCLCIYTSLGYQVYV